MMLREEQDVEVVGQASNGLEAVAAVEEHAPDIIFLDIQMPGMNGFELLAKLPGQPSVVFTTAFDEYALNAFEVNSIDYLLKPIEAAHLDRALTKLERLRGGAGGSAEAERLRAVVLELAKRFPERIASRVGDRVVFVDLDSVTHFYAKDKLTYASTSAKDYVVDNTISELEQKLDPARFVRIHRATLLNVKYIEEMNSWFGGGMVVRLKDGKRTELQVARDRVRHLRAHLDF